MAIELKEIQVKWMGISPLLMNSNVTVNPLHPISIERKKITGKRKKTEDDILELLDLDYKAGIYYEEDLGPVIPAICVEATIRNAAKTLRRGTDVKSCVFVTPDFIKLEYTGPRKLEDLIKDQRFRNVQVVKVQRSSLLKCRPKFDKWEIEFTLAYDNKIFDDDTIVQIMDIAGGRIGLCDYRPRYGRFEALL